MQPNSRSPIVSTFILNIRRCLLFLTMLSGLGVFAVAQTAESGSAAQHTPEAGQKTFPSAEAAMEALYAAVKSDDTDALMAIFGSGGKELVLSGDEVQDKNGRHNFVERYDQMHRLVPESATSFTLETGAENWPLAIPIVEANGAWFFDTASGKQEILYRRIGKNELAAIETCGILVEAQLEYASQPREPSDKKLYAAKFISDPGKQNGLYWKADDNDASPIGPLIADAAAQGYSGRTSPYHGYYFRILTRQGPAAAGGATTYMVNGLLEHGFAFLAYPAEYRNSGVVTFIVAKDGVVYQKDLGPTTADLAKAMTTYNPDKTWKKVE